MCAWIDSVPKFLDLDMEYNPLTLSINLLINNIEYDSVAIKKRIIKIFGVWKLIAPILGVPSEV